MVMSFKQFAEQSELTEEVLLIEKVNKAMEETIALLKKKLKLKKADFKTISANRIAILTDGNRQGLLEKIANILAPLEWRYNSTTKISSIGHVELANLAIFVKPRSRQGLASAGLDNEQILIGGIREYIKNDAGGAMTVTFTAGNKRSTHKDIVKVKDVGRDTAGRKKADIVLINAKGKEFPVSIKKDGAEIWESADNYWGENTGKFIKALLKEDKIKLDLQNAGHYKMSPNFAVKANKKEIKDVVFGEDILAKKGVVVERTFRPKDFLYNGDKNELIIHTTSLIRSLDEVKGRAVPWFLVRNDSTRNVRSIGYRGIRVLAVYDSRINKKVLRVKRSLIK